MREERLLVHPFEDMQILDYTSVQQENEHARARIRGMIPFDKKDRYADTARKELWLQIVALSAQGEEILFYGIADHVRIEVRSGTAMMDVSVSSGTLLMDIQRHTRSFQDEEFTYGDLLDICNEEYPEAGKIMTEGKGRKIPHFIMQYQETDWSFIKRLASMNKAVVFADCFTKGEKYHFGIPCRKAQSEDEKLDRRIQYDIQEYWIRKKNGLGIRAEDMASYIWESREMHKLGEEMLVDGRHLLIWKVESRMKGNELYHTCYMKPRSGFQVPVAQNPYLSGSSLSGKVKKVRRERVQIEIGDDEHKNQKKLRWFSFSTVYSSADGTGWYCMPETGDTIRLYFPTNREEEAYVASAYHEEGGSLRTQPEHKFWRNKEGKEIRLSPDRILMTNNDGTYIELSDEKGIEMVSEGSITIWSKESLRINAGSSIELSAPNEVTVRQGNTKMNLGGDIAMQGARILL